MGDLVRGWCDIGRRASNEGQASEYRERLGRNGKPTRTVRRLFDGDELNGW